MSTFKRLFNIGKGKAKAASRDVGEAFGSATTSVSDGQWADDVRHRAADAAEAIAGVIRPEDGPQPEESATPPAPEPTVRREPVSAKTDDEPVEPPPKPKGPRKRTL